MNAEPVPALAERLMSVPLIRLGVRLSLALTRFAYADTAFQRERARAEIAAIRAEYARRGVPVAE